MHPLSDNKATTIYVPVDTDKVHLRKLMGKDEIISIIRHSATEKIEWIDNTNLRKAAYSAILRGDDTSRIIALITVLHTRKARATEAGRKFSAFDEKILHDAERKILQKPLSTTRRRQTFYFNFLCPKCSSRSPSTSSHTDFKLQVLQSMLRLVKIWLSDCVTCSALPSVFSSSR